MESKTVLETKNTKITIEDIKIEGMNYNKTHRKKFIGYNFKLIIQNKHDNKIVYETKDELPYGGLYLKYRERIFVYEDIQKYNSYNSLNLIISKPIRKTIRKYFFEDRFHKLEIINLDYYKKYEYFDLNMPFFLISW